MVVTEKKRVDSCISLCICLFDNFKGRDKYFTVVMFDMFIMFISIFISILTSLLHLYTFVLF